MSETSLVVTIGVEVKDAVKHLTMHKTAPTTKNYSAQNVNSVEGHWASATALAFISSHSLTVPTCGQLQGSTHLVRMLPISLLLAREYLLSLSGFQNTVDWVA